MYVTSSSFGACPICVRLSLQRHPLFNVLSGAAACRCRRARKARPHCLPPHVLHAGPGSGICRGSAAAGGCLEYMAGASRAGTSGWAVHPLALRPMACSCPTCWEGSAQFSGWLQAQQPEVMQLQFCCACTHPPPVPLQAVPYKEHITGIGLDSAENGFPPHLFVDVFNKAAAMGLRRMAHAGDCQQQPLCPAAVAAAPATPGTVLLCHPPSKHCHHTPNVLYECSSTGLPACRRVCLHLSHVTHALPCMHAPAVCAAGEEGGAENIWSALKDLQVDRIDHGVRCLDDPALVAHLEKCRTALTVCPLCNLCLQVSASLRAPPFDGLCFCVLLFVLGASNTKPP